MRNVFCHYLFRMKVHVWLLVSAVLLLFWWTTMYKWTNSFWDQQSSTTAKLSLSLQQNSSSVNNTVLVSLEYSIQDKILMFYLHVQQVPRNEVKALPRDRDKRDDVKYILAWTKRHGHVRPGKSSNIMCSEKGSKCVWTSNRCKSSLHIDKNKCK